MIQIPVYCFSEVFETLVSLLFLHRFPAPPPSILNISISKWMVSDSLLAWNPVWDSLAFWPLEASAAFFVCCFGRAPWNIGVAGGWKTSRITKSAENSVLLVWKSCASKSVVCHQRDICVSSENVLGCFLGPCCRRFGVRCLRRMLSNNVPMDSWKTLELGRVLSFCILIGFWWTDGALWKATL